MPTTPVAAGEGYIENRGESGFLRDKCPKRNMNQEFDNSRQNLIDLSSVFMLYYSNCEIVVLIKIDVYW